MKKILWILLIINSLFSNDNITWIKWDLPPNFILDGHMKNQGWADIQLKILQNHLPQYNHDEVVMNLPRFIKTYKNKNSAKTIFCTNDLISHAELDIDDYLSIANFPFRAHFLVTTKNKAHLFGIKEQTVVLEDLIQNKNLKLVISKKRPYLGSGKVIENYLKNNDAAHIIRLSTQNIGESMFNMVIKNRADYTIEYDFRVQYYAKKLKVNEKVALFPIKENEGIFYSHVSCIKSIKGKEVIEKVNEILRKLKTDRHWLESFKNWLPNQTIKDNYTQYYNEIFLPQGDIYDENPRSR